jgi:elongation factor G
MGDVAGHLNSKRGVIEEMSERGMNKVIRSKVPLSEMFGYITTLRSMTEGRASVNMEFDHYDIVPPNVAKAIAETRGVAAAK